MSQSLIRKAFEKRLATLASPLEVAGENSGFAPEVGTAYQQHNLLPATPDNSIAGASVFLDVGLFQVTLRYPLGTGTQLIGARADAIAALFKRGTTMTESGLQIVVMLTPHIAPGFADGDRWCVPVSMRYQAQTAT